jgi:hypothetical protein
VTDYAQAPVQPPLMVLETGPAKGEAAAPPAAIVLPATPAVPVPPGARETLVATVNLAGKDLGTLTDAEKGAIVNAAATEAGVDPGQVSIGQVTVCSICLTAV